MPFVFFSYSSLSIEFFHSHTSVSALVII
jgi:hypothetical protein